MSKLKTGNKGMVRRKELLDRIKVLEGYTDPKKLELAINDDERAFIKEQANKKWRSSKGKLQISMVKTSDTIDGRLKQLRSELAKVEKHLGTRHLTKGSRVPTGYTWQYKPEPGKNYMVNPDYVRSFDPEVKASALTIEKKEEQGTATPQETNIREEIQQPQAFRVDSSMSGQNIAAVTSKEIAAKRRDRAPADLVWAQDQLPKGHTLTGPDYRGSVGGKNSVANNKARLILNRARDINRAYGGMSNEAKSDYLKNPITQLELEA